MTHGHAPPAPAEALDRRTSRLLTLAVVPLALATAVGLVVLRPSGENRRPEALGAPTELVDATVVGVEFRPCAGGSEADACVRVEARLDGGPERGETAAFEGASGPGLAGFGVGERVVLARAQGADVPAEQRYSFADYQRRRPLGWLAALFGVAVIALGRRRGTWALVGLGLSLAEERAWREGWADGRSFPEGT